MRARYTLQPFGQLRTEVDRLFNEVFAPAVADGWDRLNGGRVVPAVNIWEENDRLLLEAELPGVKAEDLDIAVVGNELTITGRRSGTEQREGVVQHRTERSSGAFTRQVTLPVDIDDERVEAKLTDGVLLVTLPKAEQARPRKIPVSSGESVQAPSIVSTPLGLQPAGPSSNLPGDAGGPA